MTRSVAASFAVVVFAGCAPRYDVNVAWTIGGFSATESCRRLAAPSMRFRLDQQDSGGPVVEETSSAACVDSRFVVHSAAFSNLFLDLLEGEEVYGTAGPLPLSPGLAAGVYLGEDKDSPVRTDIRVQRGRLHAHFTVGGKECAAVGASSFTATLRQNIAPGTEEIVAGEENVNVPCAGGTAVLDYEPVEVGSLYDIVATTSIGGVKYATAQGSGGDGVIVGGLATALLVDLDVDGTGQ